MVDSLSRGRHLWRRLTYWYGELLVLAARDLARRARDPGRLQIFSRFTALIPHYIWTEEMAPFLFVWTIMVGAMIGVRESTHFEVDLWPRLSARAEAAIKLTRGSPCSSSRSCSYGPASGSPASAGIASPSWPSCRSGRFHRLADRRRDLADFPRRADVRRAAGARGRPHDGLVAVVGQARDPVRPVLPVLFLRVPIAFALASLPILLIEPRLSTVTLVQETFNAYNSFILLAVLFFLLTANLMNIGGITDRLLRLSRAMVGHFPRRARPDQRRAVDLLRRGVRPRPPMRSQSKIFIEAQTRKATICRSRSRSRRSRPCWP